MNRTTASGVEQRTVRAAHHPFLVVHPALPVAVALQPFLQDAPCRFGPLCPDRFCNTHRLGQQDRHIQHTAVGAATGTRHHPACAVPFRRVCTEGQSLHQAPFDVPVSHGIRQNCRQFIVQLVQIALCHNRLASTYSASGLTFCKHIGVSSDGGVITPKTYISRPNPSVSSEIFVLYPL